MSNSLIQKLNGSGFLTIEDHAEILKFCSGSRTVEANRDLAHDGERADNVQLILQGIAYRYKILPGGRRQITAVFIPGDFCDLHIAILDRMDHSIATLTSCVVVSLSRATIENLTADHPRIIKALWWATLVDEAILRAWLVNMGQRQAAKQLAHLFCELEARLSTVGLSSRKHAGASYSLPFRQMDLADLLGMAAVHVHRTLKELHAADLILLRHRHLYIPDIARLHAYCGFDPAYLHHQTRTNRP